jgi:hypothetical protein
MICDFMAIVCQGLDDLLIFHVQGILPHYHEGGLDIEAPEQLAESMQPKAIDGIVLMVFLRVVAVKFQKMRNGVHIYLNGAPVFFVAFT